jgi:DNA-binding CsgD family transcriptional regulator
MMKNDKINELVRANINSVQSIDERREILRKTIDQNRLELSQLTTVRSKIRKKFDFIKSLDEADRIKDLAELFPEIDSGRQLQIISEMLKFKPNAEIASICFIGETSVKFHKTNIFRILKVNREKGLFAEYELRKGLSKCPTK